MKDLVGDDPYYVLVFVSFDIDGIKNGILTTFNKNQARVAKDILFQTHENRSQWGIQILNLLESMKNSKDKSKRLKIDTHISATLWRNGIIERAAVPLHWRAIRLLALACVTNQEPMIRRLASVFQNIEAGLYEAKSTVKPFEFLEKQKLIT